MRTSILTALAAAMLGLPGVLTAQSGTVQAEATVLTPITVTGEQDLQFGNIFPGVAATVTPDAAAAGRFQLSGAGTSEVNLDFDLPASLDHQTTASTLGLTFDAASAGWGATSTTVDATFDPTSTLDVNLDGGGLYVFIGGTVTPTTTQEAGTYDGTVTLTVTYTGS